MKSPHSNIREGSLLMQGSGRQVVLAAKCHEAGKTVKLVTGKWRVSGR